MIRGTAIKKRLIGRTITSVWLRPFSDGRGGKSTDPVIILDDGSRLYFDVQETDMSRYGVELKLLLAQKEMTT